MRKYTIIVITIIVAGFLCPWVFNHIDPYIGLVWVSLVIVLIYKQVKTIIKQLSK